MELYHEDSLNASKRYKNEKEVSWRYPLKHIVHRMTGESINSLWIHWKGQSYYFYKLLR